MFKGFNRDRSSIRPSIAVSIAFSLLAISALMPMRVQATVPQQSSEAEAENVLLNLQEAMKTTSYRGVFMFFRGNMMNSMKIIRRWKEGEVQERLIQLDGQMGEVIRSGTKVVCILPNNKAINLEQSSPSGHVGRKNFDAKKILELYRVRLLGNQRVAGHEAASLHLRATDRYRYSYRLSVEKRSNLPLKTELLAHDGEVLERYQFSQISIGVDIKDQELQPNKSGSTLVHNYLDAGKETKEEGVQWFPKWLPKGFVRIGASKSIRFGDGGKMDSMAFSDGLAAFTVFVERQNKYSIPEGGSRMGATVAYTHKHDGNVVTVVGEVPAVTAMKVAQSVVPESKLQPAVTNP